MKHKVSELEGAALDAAVFSARYGPDDSYWSAPGRAGRPPRYSSDRDTGAALILGEGIKVRRLKSGEFSAVRGGGPRMRGRTDLIAAMRAYVASKFGEEVDL